MDFTFFDYKGVWRTKGFESDLFSTQHIVFIVLVFVLAPILSICLRKASREKISIALKALSIFAVLLEIIKITWESYFDITTGQGFNWGGLLPIYTCSLYIYTLVLAAWTHGKVRDVSLSFLCTIGLLFGGIGTVYCNGLNYYPFWTFGAFYSLFFHSAMFATGLYLLISGYKKPTWNMIPQSFIPVCLLSLVAIPVNYCLGCDYMLLYSAGSVPVYEDLAAFLASKGLRWIFTCIMLLTHIPLAALVTTVAKGIDAVCELIKKAIRKKEQ